MIVGCPKCQAKLKVPDEKIRAEGSKFRCPKCRAMLMVRRPAQKAERTPPPMPPAPEELRLQEPGLQEPGLQEPGLQEPGPQEPGPQEMEPSPPLPLPEEGLGAPAPPEEEGPEKKGAEGGLLPEEPEEPPAFGAEPGSEPPPFPFPETPGESSLEESEPSAQEPQPFEEQASPSMESATEPSAPPEEAEAPEPAPEAGPEAETRAEKILIALPDPQAVNLLKFVLMGADYDVISAQDGVEAMVKALRERPAAVVVDVRLPKIHGVEVMKRLKTRSETEGIKVILTGTKAEAEVPPIRGAAGYIHQDRLQQGLLEVIRQALSAPPEKAPEPVPGAGTAQPSATAPSAPAPPADAGVQRAQRFSRTVLADIELYNVDKVEQSIRQGSFEQVFAKEIQEGRKLYEMRIPEEVREKGDFYEEAVRNFLEKKRKQLGI